MIVSNGGMVTAIGSTNSRTPHPLASCLQMVFTDPPPPKGACFGVGYVDRDTENLVFLKWKNISQITVYFSKMKKPFILPNAYPFEIEMTSAASTWEYLQWNIVQELSEETAVVCFHAGFPSLENRLP